MQQIQYKIQRERERERVTRNRERESKKRRREKWIGYKHKLIEACNSGMRAGEKRKENSVGSKHTPLSISKQYLCLVTDI